MFCQGKTREVKHALPVAINSSQERSPPGNCVPTLAYPRRKEKR